jgi:transcriptional regulator GlxA family with amidase domain
MSHDIEFLLFTKGLGLDIFGPLEVFTSVGTMFGQKSSSQTGYKTWFTAKEKGPVRLNSGVEITANHGFFDAPEADTLVVPGGEGAKLAVNDPIYLEYIRNKARKVERIVSICSGSLVLAAAGLLDGKRATTHWRNAEHMAQTYPRVKVESDAIYTRDGNIYTSAGVTSGIDLALAIVEEDFGAPMALEVARYLVLYFRRPGYQSQFSAPLKAQEAAGQRFTGLHDWLLVNLSRPVTVEMMAEHAGMSPRNFARVFSKETGFTPSKYLERLRLDRAREILSSGPESLDRVAELSGFGREERLRRAFLRRFDVTPSQYQLHFM